MEKLNELIGWIMWKIGIKPSVTHNIADMIEVGYGELDMNGFWKYPAPKEAYRK